MQEMKYEEIEQRSIPSALRDEVKKLEARAVIHQQIEQMRAEGKALTLSDEEFNLLESFRRFKLRMRKNGEVFTWQTRIPDSVIITEETGIILSPQEALIGNNQ
jgi:hypothetical protein